VIARVISELKQNFAEAKDHLQGKAHSKARMIKQLQDAAGDQLRTVTDRAPRRTRLMIRTLDGHPMMFFDDGSLRHATGHKPGKAARKVLKRARHQGGA